MDNYIFVPTLISSKLLTLRCTSGHSRCDHTSKFNRPTRHSKCRSQHPQTHLTQARQQLYVHRQRVSGATSSRQCMLSCVVATRSFLTMKMTAYLVKSTIVGALGGLLFGFDTAVIAGTTQQLTTVYNLSSLTLGLTVFIGLF